MQTLSQKLFHIENRIEAAARRAGRDPGEITLVAVSKLQAVSKMQELLSLSFRFQPVVIFGENYVQEFEKKRSNLQGIYQSHLIGPLQSNKAAKAVKLFDVIESVHSESIAAALHAEAKKIEKVQKVLLQVNISSDQAKSGFSPEAVKAFIAGKLSDLKALKVKGLMTIPKLYEEPGQVRGDFRALRKLAQELSAAFPTLPNHLEISMGMSDDFEIAIEEGATIIRVGTALFGDREAL